MTVDVQSSNDGRSEDNTAVATPDDDDGVVHSATASSRQPEEDDVNHDGASSKSATKDTEGKNESGRVIGDGPMTKQPDVKDTTATVQVGAAVVSGASRLLKELTTTSPQPGSMPNHARVMVVETAEYEDPSSSNSKARLSKKVRKSGPCPLGCCIPSRKKRKDKTTLGSTITLLDLRCTVAPSHLLTFFATQHIV